MDKAIQVANATFEYARENPWRITGVALNGVAYAFWGPGGFVLPVAKALGFGAHGPVAGKSTIDTTARGIPGLHFVCCR